MYKGPPAKCFFSLLTKSFSCKLCDGEPAQICLGWVCIIIFKQLIGNLGLLCTFKMLSCRNFRGSMFIIKLYPLHFALEGTCHVS